VSSEARVIKDSISSNGDRLTTIEATMHRFVLPEFNTHRMFSRNSASSRAIPFGKQLEKVINDPAIPVSFPAERRGMQGGEELHPDDRAMAKEEWYNARNAAIKAAKSMHEIGVHKSVVNRILEPFMWHTVIVTATEWQNFFGLRCNEMAQPEIKAVAEAIRYAYLGSVPEKLNYGDWHLPYIQEDEFDTEDVELLKRVSSARCARVSYLTHDGVRNMEKDLVLFDRLSSADPMHASPMEHVATPYSAKCLGNLLGWKQFRHELNDGGGLKWTF